jgi:hypothetical protein
MKITTNNHIRLFVSRNEVPKSILDWYDHLSAEDSFDFWFCYKNHWYHISEFLSLHNKVHCPNPPEEFLGYDGYKAHGISSGVLIKLTVDGDFTIAWYCS